MGHIWEDIASLPKTADAQDVIAKINEIVERVNHVWYSEPPKDA
jgi:hypothetical protein